jgi:hypothetical protein
MRLCKTCGASLDAGDRSVICPRCGEDLGGGAEARPAPPAASGTGPSTRVKVALAVAMAFVGIGFAVMFFTRFAPPQEAAPRMRPSSRAGASREPAALGPAGKPLETYLEALCFADANGDDVLDPVLWMDGEARGQVVAVDGRSGRGLWSSEPVDKPDTLACADRATVLASGEEEPAVRALDARTGKQRWAVKLPAVPDEIAAGGGCVTVLMKDGASAGLKLEGGELADCPTAPIPDPTSGPFWERKRNPRTIQIGDVQVSLTAQAQQRLTAEGRRGGATLWKAEIPARAPVSGGRPDLFLVEGGGAAVILGLDAAGGTEARVVAVDPATGAIRYERAAGNLGGRVAAAKASGPYVYVVSGGRLRAVDPATGEAVWRATAPPKPR